VPGGRGCRGRDVTGAAGDLFNTKLPGDLLATTFWDTVISYISCFSQEKRYYNYIGLNLFENDNKIIQKST
jgi:hypothetical protein